MTCNNCVHLEAELDEAKDLILRLHDQLQGSIQPLDFRRFELDCPKYLMATDRISFEVHDGISRERIDGGEVGRPITVDSVSVFYIEDSLGYRQAMCGAFGESV
jgi:hypothetical protein